MRKYVLVPLMMLVGLLAPVAASAPAQAAACAHPRFVTSDPNGMWNNGRYVVHNNMWNTNGYNVSERLSACSFHNWKVTARADNSRGDGAVKTYPNVHRDFHNWSTGAEPRLSSFSTIRSSWAARTPNVGIYNAAYDLWLNGVPGSNEVMIWTYNHRQLPAGDRVGRVRIGGHAWSVWATQDNSYIAFVPRHRLTHGTVAIKSMLTWLVRHHRISASSTLGQICYGVEIVSTGGRQATFKVDNFSVTTRR